MDKNSNDNGQELKKKFFFTKFRHKKHQFFFCEKKKKCVGGRMVVDGWRTTENKSKQNSAIKMGNLSV